MEALIFSLPEVVVVEVPVPTRQTTHAAEAAGFEAFYRREYPAVVALAYALSGRTGAAEDVAQEAFLVAHQHWATVGGYDKPGAYVRRVVANMAVSQGRRRAAEARALKRMVGRREADGSMLDPPDAQFWRAVRSLGGRQAQVLALHYLEDRSAEEIGEILGCAPATVRVHLHRGRAALESRLGEAER